MIGRISDLREQRGGFTLVEMLVVLGIILLLMGLLLPTLRSARQRAQGTGCAAREQQIGQAMLIYSLEYDGHLPIGAYNTASARPVPDWNTSFHDLLLPYLDYKTQIFQCPSAPAGGLRGSYGCNPWLSTYYGALAVSDVGPGDRIWVADHQTGDWPVLPWDYWDNATHSYLTPRHQGRVAVLYLDGHVNMRRPEDLGLSTGLWRP